MPKLRRVIQPAIVRTPTFSLGFAGQFAGRIGGGMLPFMTYSVFLQVVLVFTFHAGLMMIPMVLERHGNEADCRCRWLTVLAIVGF